MSGWRRALTAVLAALTLAGCAWAPSGGQEPPAASEPPLPSPPAEGGDGLLLLPEAAGAAVQENDRAVIDYSNAGDGYVMVLFRGQTDRRLKVKVQGPCQGAADYDYDLIQGQWTTFPLSQGDGDYQVTVYEHTGTGDRYAAVLSAAVSAELADPQAPFLRPNQYVDYAQAVQTLDKARELTQGLEEPLERVEALYTFVVEELSYDQEKAQHVQSGYLPALDDVLAQSKGICLDYAALLAAMLRSQGVPCQLVVGDAGGAYHAWVNVWAQDSGWVGETWFQAGTWQRLDPTFASNSQDPSIQDYIGDGENYTAQYIY